MNCTRCDGTGTDPAPPGSIQALIKDTDSTGLQRVADKLDRKVPKGTPLRAFLDMLQRDFIWIVCVLILFMLLLVMYGEAKGSENACDARYYNYVLTCYQAHGLVPSDAAYNLSAFNDIFNLNDTGERWQKTPEARTGADGRIR